MDRDTRAITSLQAAVLMAAGNPTLSPDIEDELETSRGLLADAPDLEAAMDRYRTALARATEAGGVDLDEALARTATGPIAFLEALRDAVRPLVAQARDLGIDLGGGVRIGPAGLTLTAPIATVRPDPGVVADTARASIAHFPISGLAAELSLGPIHASGAGFLDAPERAAGAALRADLGAARVDLALLVDAQDGLAVFGLLRAEFRPTGIQLGLGFSLDAVGGFVGVNRDVDGDRMRDRIADGSALDALFGGGTGPAASRRIALALSDIFPARAGIHVAGPTLRLGWLTIQGGSLVRLDIGVIVVIPSGRVVLPGRIVVEVPGPGVPLLHLRLDVLGEVDAAGKRLALDAALVHSRVLGTLSITGTAAVRMAWGDPTVVLATAGGFYPGFRHEPATIPPQRRIGIALANPIPAGLRISLEGYVAIAAGTLQMGASASVALGLPGASISGTAGFDAIVQLSPLWFEARVFGSVSLRALGRRLMAVDLHGSLTGPGPTVLTATATGEILGIDVGGTRSFTLSAGPGADREPFDGLGAVVARLLEDGAHVAGEGGGDRDVVLAPRHPAGDGAPLLAPGATLVWAQGALPLGDPITKADGRVLRHATTVTVTTRAGMTTSVERRLTTASFTHLAAADALTIHPFDDRRAGWRLAQTVARSTVAHEVDTDHRTVTLPVTEATPRWLAIVGAFQPFAVHVALRALDRPAAVAAGVGPAVEVRPESWLVAGAGATPGPHTSGSAAHAHAALRPGGRALPAAAATMVTLP